MNSSDFYKIANVCISNAKENQRANILKASQIMGDCMLNNGVIQLFGLKEGEAFSMELGYRAGGLMPFHQFKTKDLLLRGVISNEEWMDPGFYDSKEMAKKLWELYNIQPEDMFVLISNAGNNGLIVEVAEIAKSKGHKIIVVTSVNVAKNSVSLHENGKNIMDYADLVIDNMSNDPDLVIEHQGLFMNQTSTIVGNVIAQMLTAETYKYLSSIGHKPGILLSVNIKGADEHNRAMAEQYVGRWNS